MRYFERERLLWEGDCITFEFLKGDTLLLLVLRNRLDSVSESTADFFLIEFLFVWSGFRSLFFWELGVPGRLVLRLGFVLFRLSRDSIYFYNWPMRNLDFFYC
jgi:hypothetical protein